MHHISNNLPFKKLILIIIILCVVCFILWKFNTTFVDIVKNASSEITGYKW